MDTSTCILDEEHRFWGRPTPCLAKSFTQQPALSRKTKGNCNIAAITPNKPRNSAETSYKYMTRCPTRGFPWWTSVVPPSQAFMWHLATWRGGRTGNGGPPLYILEFIGFLLCFTLWQEVKEIVHVFFFLFTRN